MSTWSSRDDWYFAWPQVRCEGIGSTWRTGHRHGSFRVYSMRQDVFDFGKHSGKHINQVDNGYLEWMVNNFQAVDDWEMKRQQSAIRNVHVHDLLSDLKSCTRKKDLHKGKRVHAKAVETGNESNMYVAATLINMYAKCGSMVDARTVFDIIQEPDVVSWTAVIMGYADSAQGLAALDLFSRMKDERRCPPDSTTYLAALKACTSLAADGDESEKKRCLERGREIHLEIGCHMSQFVQNTLVDMYAKCGNMVDARRMFDSIQEPDVVSWTALILGYADDGQGLVALDCFSRMKEECRYAPNCVTYLAALKACTSLAADGDETRKKRCLERGREIHLEIGCHMNQFVQNTLIDMYAKCGSIVDARSVFDSIQEPDVVSWNAVILGYADSGQGLAALDLFSRMKDKRRCAPDSVTFVSALKACTSLAADESGKKRCLERGREIHLEIGCHMNQFVKNTLIDMYAKCGSMVDARSVFDSIQEPDVVSWNAVILGYADSAQGLAALDLFSRMKDERRCLPDSTIYLAVLKACTSLAADGDETGKRRCLERGREIHLEIGCHMNQFVQNTLIDMYAKCGSIVDARSVFDSIQKPDVVSWNAVILGYADSAQGLAALDLFSRMKDERRCPPDSTTYLAALKACTSLAVDGDETGKRRCLERGREIHLDIGCHMNLFLQNTLVDMYAKCGSMVYARSVFDSIQEPDVVSWTALILGYADDGQGLVALDCFSRMKEECRCAPNCVTYLAALKACMSLAANGDETGKKSCLERGRLIHMEIGCHMNQFVQNTLIDMYAKCGSMVYARNVFDNIQQPDVVSWNTLILGYADDGQGRVALDCFSRMKNECRCVPNCVTYVAALKACGLNGALAIGQKFHSEIREFDAYVVTSLVDFYAKCGNMEEAREVFDLHPQARDVSTWNALLIGYGRFGNTNFVFSLFKVMQDQDFRPNAITFLCILGCCNHAGMIEKAWEYLKVMPIQYGLTPTVMHYNCMVDLLGRTNKLDEAIDLLQNLPCDPDAVTWMTLLGACRKWENVEIGRMAFKSLVNLNKKKASAYILMAAIYSSKGMWKEQEKVLQTKMKFGAWKLPGQAYMMDGLGRMVKFVVEEKDPEYIEDKLKEFLKCMQEHEYVDKSYNMSHSIMDNEKEKALCGHSERCVVVYGTPHELLKI